MNRKGQALVEFVLILPVLVFILFVIFDFGNIFYSKYDLQNQSSDIIKLIQNGSTKEEVIDIYNKLNVEINVYKEKYRLVTITKKVDLITPLMHLVIDDPYVIKVERVIPNEET